MSDARAFPAVAAVVAAVAVAACLLVDSPAGRIAVLAATLATSTALELARSRNVLSPVVVVAGLFAWFYVAKPLHVLEVGVISSGTSVDAIPVLGAWRSVMAEALLAVTVAFCLVNLAFQIVVAGRRPAPAPRPATTHELDPALFRLAAAAVVAIDVVAFGLLVRAAGGLSAYVGGLALRSDSLAGLSFLTLATVPLNLLLLVGLTARFRGVRGAPGSGLLLALGGLALGSALLTGGRASLLTGLLLPVLVVVHYARRRIGAVVAASLAFAGMVAYVALGALLRDSQFSRTAGLGPWDFVRARLGDLHESLVGGLAVVPYDSLVRVMGARAFGDLTWQQGATYRSILTWPVPRALWAEKPAGGGNAWFTETYVPRFYGDERIESSLSFVGESYANFGWAGVVLGSLLMGTLVGLLHARLRHARLPGVGGSGDAFSLPLYAAVLGFLSPAFRGDAYHNVTGVVFAVAVWWGMRAVLTRVPARTAQSALASSRTVAAESSQEKRPASSRRLAGEPGVVAARRRLALISSTDVGSANTAEPAGASHRYAGMSLSSSVPVIEAAASTTGMPKPSARLTLVKTEASR